jgi:hypothetical protein
MGRPKKSYVWTPEMEAEVWGLYKAEVPLREITAALNEHHGLSLTKGAIDSRISRIKARSSLAFLIFGSEAVYQLSTCRPWVSRETRLWLDSLHTDEPLPIPADEDLDPHLDGLIQVAT